MYIINNWKIVRHVLPDGNIIICLFGEVFGNPRFKSGGAISTSAIERYAAKTDSVFTVNGSEYQLGKPDSAEPFAKQRLIRSLEEIHKAATPRDFSNTTDKTNISYDGSEEADG